MIARFRNLIVLLLAMGTALQAFSQCSGCSAPSAPAERGGTYTVTHYKNSTLQLWTSSNAGISGTDWYKVVGADTSFRGSGDTITATADTTCKYIARNKINCSCPGVTLYSSYAVMANITVVNAGAVPAYSLNSAATICSGTPTDIFATNYTTGLVFEYVRDNTTNVSGTTSGSFNSGPFGLTLTNATGSSQVVRFLARMRKTNSPIYYADCQSLYVTVLPGTAPSGNHCLFPSNPSPIYPSGTTATAAATYYRGSTVELTTDTTIQADSVDWYRVTGTDTVSVGHGYSIFLTADTPCHILARNRNMCNCSSASTYRSSYILMANISLASGTAPDFKVVNNMGTITSGSQTNFGIVPLSNDGSNSVQYEWKRENSYVTSSGSTAVNMSGALTTGTAWNIVNKNGTLGITLTNSTSSPQLVKIGFRAHNLTTGYFGNCKIVYVLVQGNTTGTGTHCYFPVQTTTISTPTYAYFKGSTINLDVFMNGVNPTAADNIHWYQARGAIDTPDLGSSYPVNATVDTPCNFFKVASNTCTWPDNSTHAYSNYNYPMMNATTTTGTANTVTLTNNAPYISSGSKTNISLTWASANITSTRFYWNRNNTALVTGTSSGSYNGLNNDTIGVPLTDTPSTSPQVVNFLVNPTSNTSYYGSSKLTTVTVYPPCSVWSGRHIGISPAAADTICSGDTITLASDTLPSPGGTTYAWSTGATTKNIRVTASGTYSVKVTNFAGCTASASASVVVKSKPTPTVNSPAICAGATATLTAAGGAGYHWSTGANTSSITASTAGTYYVTATNASGCSATASGSVTVNANPTPTVNSPAICAGATATLTATGGASYIWSTSATTTSITTSSAGTYYVTATNAAGCSAIANGTVTVNTNPTPTVNNDTICAGDTATLIAMGGTSYVWSTGATTSSIKVVSAGTYTVSATNISGCTATVSGVVLVNALPSPTVNNDTICAGDTAVLSASGGVSYIWSTGAAVASIKITASGTYSVTVSNALGCKVHINGHVLINTKPQPNAGRDTSIYSGNNVILGSASFTGGIPPYIFRWYPAFSLDDAIHSRPLAFPSINTSYILSVQDSNGCIGRDTVNVTVVSAPPSSLFVAITDTLAGLTDSISFGHSVTFRTHFANVGALANYDTINVSGNFDCDTCIKMTQLRIYINSNTAPSLTIDSPQLPINIPVYIPAGAQVYIEEDLSLRSDSCIQTSGCMAKRRLGWDSNQHATGGVALRLKHPGTTVLRPPLVSVVFNQNPDLTACIPNTFSIAVRCYDAISTPKDTSAHFDVKLEFGVNHYDLFGSATPTFTWSPHYPGNIHANWHHDSYGNLDYIYLTTDSNGMHIDSTTYTVSFTLTPQCSIIPINNNPATIYTEKISLLTVDSATNASQVLYDSAWPYLLNNSSASLTRLGSGTLHYPLISSTSPAGQSYAISALGTTTIITSYINTGSNYTGNLSLHNDFMRFRNGVPSNANNEIQHVSATMIKIHNQPIDSLGLSAIYTINHNDTFDIIQYVKIDSPGGCINGHVWYSDIDLSYGCSPNLCRNAGVSRANLTATDAPIITIGRIYPTDSIYWENHCLGNSSTQDWEFLIENTGTGYADSVGIILDKLLGSTYTYILKNSIKFNTVNSSFFTSSVHAIYAGTSGDTLRNLTGSYHNPYFHFDSTYNPYYAAPLYPGGSQVPSCLSSAAGFTSTNPSIEGWYQMIDSIPPHTRMILSFTTIRCCPFDASPNGDKNFNTWQLSARFKDNCNNQYASSAPAYTVVPSTTVKIYPVNFSGNSISYERYGKNTTGDMGIAQLFSQPCTDLKIPQGSTCVESDDACPGKFYVTNRHFTGLVNGSYDLDPMLFSISGHIVTDSFGQTHLVGDNPDGTLEIFLGSGSGNIDFSHSGVYVSKGSYSHWLPYSSTRAFCQGDSGYIFAFRLSDLNSIVPLTTTDSFKNFFQGSKLYFNFSACCSGVKYNPNTNPPVKVVTMFRPSACSSIGQSCRDSCSIACEIPLSVIDFDLHLHCPGCTTPGIIMSSNGTSFDRDTSSLGFMDSDDNGIPDQPLTRVALATSGIHANYSIVGDKLKSVSHAHIQAGDNGVGFQLNDWQNYWDTVAGGSAPRPLLNKFYFYQSLIGAGTVGLHCTDAYVHYSPDNGSTWYTASASGNIGTQDSGCLFVCAADLSSFTDDSTHLHAPLDSSFKEGDRFTVEMYYSICHNPDRKVVLDGTNFIYLISNTATANNYSVSSYNISGYNTGVQDTLGNWIHNVVTAHNYCDTHNLTRGCLDTFARDSTTLQQRIAAVPPSGNFYFLCEACGSIHYTFPIKMQYSENWTDGQECNKELSVKIKSWIVGDDLNMFTNEFRPMPDVDLTHHHGLMDASGLPYTTHVPSYAGYSITPDHIESLAPNYSNPGSPVYINVSTPYASPAYFADSANNYRAKAVSGGNVSFIEPSSALTLSGGQHIDTNPAQPPSPQILGGTTKGLLIGDEYYEQNIIFKVKVTCVATSDTVPVIRNIAPGDAYVKASTSAYQGCSQRTSDTAYDAAANRQILITPHPQVTAGFINLSPHIHGGFIDFDLQVFFQNSSNINYPNGIVYLDLDPSHISPGITSTSNPLLVSLDTGFASANIIHPVFIPDTPYFRYSLGNITRGSTVVHFRFPITSCISAGDTLNVPIYYAWSCDSTDFIHLPPAHDRCFNFSGGSNKVTASVVLPRVVEDAVLAQRIGHQTTLGGCDTIAYRFVMTSQDIGGTGRYTAVITLPPGASISIPDSPHVSWTITRPNGGIHNSTACPTCSRITASHSSPRTSGPLTGWYDWTIDMRGLTEFTSASTSLVGENGLNAVDGVLEVDFSVVTSCNFIIPNISYNLPVTLKGFKYCNLLSSTPDIAHSPGYNNTDFSFMQTNYSPYGHSRCSMHIEDVYYDCNLKTIDFAVGLSNDSNKYSALLTNTTTGQTTQITNISYHYTRTGTGIYIVGPPYDFSFNNPVPFGYGHYMLQIQDSLTGCTDSRYFDILPPWQLTIKDSNITPDCSSGHIQLSGTLTAYAFDSATGAPLTRGLWYYWPHNSSFYKPTPLVSGRTLYTVYATDSSGCQHISTINLDSNFRVVGNNVGVPDITTAVRHSILLPPSQAMTMRQFVMVDGSFLIDSFPYYFARNSNILCKKNSLATPTEIIVQGPAGYLKIDSSQVHGCTNLWKGITVKNNALSIRNSYISDACFAVRIERKTHQSFVLAPVYNSILRNNIVGVYVPSRDSTNWNDLVLLNNNIFNAPPISISGYPGTRRLLPPYTGMSSITLPPMMPTYSQIFNDTTGQWMPWAGIFAQGSIGLDTGRLEIDIWNGYADSANIWNFEGLANGIVTEGVTLGATACNYKDILRPSTHHYTTSIPSIPDMHGYGVFATGAVNGNVPNNKFALVVNGNYNSTVRRGTRSTIDRFRNCYAAICSDRMDAGTETNLHKMTDVKYGVEIRDFGTRSTGPSYNTDINDNDFGKSCRIGAKVNNGMTTCFVISGNTMDITAPGEPIPAVGIDVQNMRNTFVDSIPWPIYINENRINMGANAAIGININNLKRDTAYPNYIAEVKANHVRFNDTTNRTGIWYTASTIHSLCNLVNSGVQNLVLNSADSITGIHFSNCNFLSTSDNTDSMNIGMRISAGNGISTPQYANFGRHYTGFLIDPLGTLGLNDSVHHRYNQWNGIYNGPAAVNRNLRSIYRSQRLFVDTNWYPYVFDPTIVPVLSPNSVVPLTGWYDNTHFRYHFYSYSPPRFDTIQRTPFLIINTIIDSTLIPNNSRDTFLHNFSASNFCSSAARLRSGADALGSDYQNAMNIWAQHLTEDDAGLTAIDEAVIEGDTIFGEGEITQLWQMQRYIYEKLQRKPWLMPSGSDEEYFYDLCHGTSLGGISAVENGIADLLATGVQSNNLLHGLILQSDSLGILRDSITGAMATMGQPDTVELAMIDGLFKAGSAIDRQMDCILKSVAVGRSTQLASLLSQNDAINDGGMEVVAHAKELNHIYLTALMNGGPASIINTDATGRIDYLAQLCPLTAGYAVYAARGIRSLWSDAVYNDDALCPADSSGYRLSQTATEPTVTMQTTLSDTRRTVKIYPNPAASMLYIRSGYDPDHSYRFSITDMQGRLVRSSDIVFKQDVVSYDVSALPIGLYNVRLQLDGETVYSAKLNIMR